MMYIISLYLIISLLFYVKKNIKFYNYINSFNNYYLKFKKDRFLLNELYVYIINIIDDDIINKLRKINFFKRHLDTLLNTSYIKK